MQETAYAKVNLALHVRAREPDGYHRIETIFAFCEHGDVLTVSESEELSLTVEGPFAGALGDPDDNLALRAATALKELSGARSGAALRLDKRLPVASGIGGGSADAGAALRLLMRWWDLSIAEADLLRLSSNLGADVPACLWSRTARGEGRGDLLDPLDDPSIAGTPVLLVNPKQPLGTGAVFRAWDGVDRGPLDDYRSGRNDLEAPAVSLVPEIEAVLGALCGARLARMSGSGATCFGLYDSVEEREAAAAAIAAAQPHWWTLASRLR